jgi:AAA domain
VKTPEERKLELISRFKTFSQMKAQEGGEPPKFIVEGILPENALVTFQGPAKSGKSTLLFHLIKCMMTGTKFNDQHECQKISVVYLSEQPRAILLKQLQDAGIDDTCVDLHLCSCEDNWNLTWEQAFELGRDMVEATKAKLLIIDSWGRFAQFAPSENEMTTAPTQLRVTKLRGIQATTKCCVLINQHVNKGSRGQGMVNAGMGSSALAQQADYLLSLSGEPKRPDIPADQLKNDNCRALQGMGRFAPIKMAVELTPTGYVLSEFVQRKRGKSWDSIDAESIQFTGNYKILADHFAVNPDDWTVAGAKLESKLNISASTINRYRKQNAPNHDASQNDL